MEQLHSRGRVAESAREQVLQLFRKAFDAFNRGDITAFEATWADRVDAIINQVSPYVWTGEDALRQWLAASASHSMSAGVTSATITAGTPLGLEIVGDSAFVVMPVVMAFVQSGVALQQRGTQVCVLNKSEQGWRFKSLAYGGEAPTEVT
jgi:ketosteroid isomerase-like protein